MERLTSSKWISAIERPMILDVVNEGHGQPATAAIMVSGYHADTGHLNWALDVFDDDRKDEDNNALYALTGRIAAAP